MILFSIFLMVSDRLAWLSYTILRVGLREADAREHHRAELFFIRIQQCCMSIKAFTYIYDNKVHSRAAHSRLNYQYQFRRTLVHLYNIMITRVSPQWGRLAALRWSVTYVDQLYPIGVVSNGTAAAAEQCGFSRLSNAVRGGEVTASLDGPLRNFEFEIFSSLRSKVFCPKGRANHGEYRWRSIMILI